LTELAGFLAQNGLQALLAFTKSWIVLIEPDGSLVEWNPSFGRVKESLPQAGFLQDFLTASSHALFNGLLQGTSPWQGRLEFLIGPDSARYDCLLTALPAGGCLFFAEPVSVPPPDEIARLSFELQAARRQLERKTIDLESVMAQVDEIAHTDLLTFLSNRRQIIGDIQREVAACDRYGKPLTIFMVDIDHFKRINDTLGHAAGDEVLRVLANQLLEGIRHSDNVGRYGGEEFLVVLPETALEPAVGLAERLLELVRALKVDVGHQVVKLTISIGIAQYQTGQETWEALLERADKALYQSKHAGRDRWSLSKFEPILPE
jgi:diguanylate cyclase (GGDEF)-like protein